MSKCWICGKEMTKTIGGCEHCKDCGTGYNDLVFRPQNETIIYHNKIVDNGTAIHLTCDYCGREIFGCTFVNGMKFCAKCYQETFGETDKDKQIAELKKQLKASEQLQDQKVIEVLDKVKYDLLDISSPYWQYFAKSGNAFMTYEDIEQWVKEFIDNQIKSLKGEE